MSENRKYHRTQVTMMLGSNRRLQNNSGRGGVNAVMLADSEMQHFPSVTFSAC